MSDNNLTFALLYTPPVGSGVDLNFLSSGVSCTGNGFNTSPTIYTKQPYSFNLVGRGFSTAPVIFPGATVIGRGFSTTPIILPGATVIGRGFSTTPHIFSGAVAIGQGFSTAPIVRTKAPYSFSLSGRGFSTAPRILSLSAMDVLGRGFSTTLSVIYQAARSSGVIGQGFSTSPKITFEPKYGSYLVGNSFSVTPRIFGGSVEKGRSFSTAPTIVCTVKPSAYILGRGFSASLYAKLNSSTFVKVSGQTLKPTPKMFGGAVTSGRGFLATLKAPVKSATLITVKGQGFSTKLKSTLVPRNLIKVSGRGFGSSLGKTGLSGYSFSTQPTIRFFGFAEPDQALVMNIKTSQVTRYTNYPFMHLVTIGGKYYGVKRDGLYLIDGVLDIEDPVNATIVTKDTDFEMYQSKNVPFIYLNSDDNTLTTPIVDGVEQPVDPSSFTGRKVKMARGSKGRYWAFKIENITKLQGIEFLVDQLSRRVK